MLILETERLMLRDFVPGDWDALNAIVSDPAVIRYMHFATWDEAKQRHWFEWMLQIVQESQEAPNARRNRYNWAITLRGDGRLIGWLFVGGERDGSEDGTPGVGYALDQRFWGQGYMTEALRAIFDYEFTALGTGQIIAECEVENSASARVMQKSGMEYVGTFYSADFEGNWSNQQHYRITRKNG